MAEYITWRKRVEYPVKRARCTLSKHSQNEKFIKAKSISAPGYTPGDGQMRRRPPIHVKVRGNDGKFTVKEITAMVYEGVMYGTG